MTSLSIALLALGTTPWTYAGFVADPAPPSPPPAPAVIPATPATPAAPSTPSVSPTAAPEPATTTVVPPIPPVPPVPPVVAVAPTPHPVHYRLADVSGQLWEYADSAALQAFVQDRNRQLLGSRSFVIPLGSPSWR